MRHALFAHACGVKLPERPKKEQHRGGAAESNPARRCLADKGVGVTLDRLDTRVACSLPGVDGI